MSRRMLVFVVFISVVFLGGFGSLGCSDDGGGGGACDDTALQAMGSAVMATQCQICHSVSLTGVDRQGATLGVDFDTAADIAANRDRIKFRAESMTMPPLTEPQLSEAEVEAIVAYVDCDPQAGPME